MNLNAINFENLTEQELLSIDGGGFWDAVGNTLLVVSAIVAAATVAGPVGVVIGVTAAVGGGIVVARSW